MTYNEICNLLEEAGIENNRGEAAMLICRFCNISKVELFKRSNEDFVSDELDAAVIKRRSHYPLQYILGIWEFCHETYRVNEHTLIPRQDTEHLVELAVKLLPEGARFIDLCTGSGCVAISTLAAREDVRAVAVDLFPETVEMAGENAERNGVGDRLGLLSADVFDDSFMEVLGEFDFIVSNPPYIETAALELLDEELSFEPRAALDGGADGLDFYKKIVADYGKYLLPGGAMLFEIGYDQADALRAIAEEHGYTCEIYKDYSQNDRVAYLTRLGV
ncbi:MAG: peptide chain release factor N(5)-glutamine methyltransferase [Clostridia bacterium]|nr:peptide chain release factor N(5)-glutamine methyltransferase [Clostridia bacterium]MBO7249863.1 peptide chain release factor N(5)-glutamine methyltransferase [Clostridia bacterium]